MTITLDIPPDLEAALQEKAAFQGQAIPDYLLMVVEADLNENYEVSEEEAVVIEQGLTELHAGDKGISLEDFHSEMIEVIAHLYQKEAKTEPKKEVEIAA